ncbi:MAG: RES family NAD+ phosphorylase, partial [Terriglobus sp.]
QGGVRASGRWHSAGSPIVYLAESAAGSLLEVLVHLELADPGLPPDYTLLRITAPDDLSIEPLADSNEKVWTSALRTSRKLGDAWLAKNKTPLARVPSSIVPHTWNYLLNPQHPDAGKVTIASAEKCRFDARLVVGRRSITV